MNIIIYFKLKLVLSTPQNKNHEIKHKDLKCNQKNIMFLYQNDSQYILNINKNIDSRNIEDNLFSKDNKKISSERGYFYLKMLANKLKKIKKEKINLDFDEMTKAIGSENNKDSLCFINNIELINSHTMKIEKYEKKRFSHDIEYYKPTIGLKSEEKTKIIKCRSNHKRKRNESYSIFNVINLKVSSDRKLVQCYSSNKNDKPNGDRLSKECEKESIIKLNQCERKIANEKSFENTVFESYAPKKDLTDVETSNFICNENTSDINNNNLIKNKDEICSSIILDNLLHLIHQQKKKNFINSFNEIKSSKNFKIELNSAEIEQKLLKSSLNMDQNNIYNTKTSQNVSKIKYEVRGLINHYENNFLQCEKRLNDNNTTNIYNIVSSHSLLSSLLKQENNKVNKSNDIDLSKINVFCLSNDNCELNIENSEQKLNNEKKKFRNVEPKHFKNNFFIDEKRLICKSADVINLVEIPYNPNIKNKNTSNKNKDGLKILKLKKCKKMENYDSSLDKDNLNINPKEPLVTSCIFDKCFNGTYLKKYDFKRKANIRKKIKMSDTVLNLSNKYETNRQITNNAFDMNVSNFYRAVGFHNDSEEANNLKNKFDKYKREHTNSINEENFQSPKTNSYLETKAKSYYLFDKNIKLENKNINIYNQIFDIDNYNPSHNHFVTLKNIKKDFKNVENNKQTKNSKILYHDSGKSFSAQKRCNILKNDFFPNQYKNDFKIQLIECHANKKNYDSDPLNNIKK